MAKTYKNYIALLDMVQIEKPPSTFFKIRINQKIFPIHFGSALAKYLKRSLMLLNKQSINGKINLLSNNNVRWVTGADQLARAAERQGLKHQGPGFL